ncbi:MAG TPA: aldolase/citrate lyase family protein [Pseudonocardiaceae bacterium]|nr:aldolase/citrate lyase family protein [Pseudonocardiaceae bacterium]
MITDFARRLRSRETISGYWISSGNPAISERVATTGYDYVCIDLQHGLMDYAATLNSLIAVQAGGSVGVVRVPTHEPAWIGRALDAGAQTVIVPLVNNAAEAEAVVRATQYPPAGVRSFGPTRSSLRIGPDPRDSDESVGCIVMIETAEAIQNIEAICAVPGLSGVYVGPADLALALGAQTPGAGPDLPAFAQTLDRVCKAAAESGIAAGMHCFTGDAAAAALRTGFTFFSISNDLNHLEQHARRERERALGL